MGRRGPPPLPRALKEQRGTLKKSREAKSPPAGTVGIPDVPAGLDDRERRAWAEEGARLVARGVLKREHGNALLMLVKAKVRYLRAAAKVREEGEVLVNPATKEQKRNVWVDVMDRAWEQYRRAMLELGDTPSAESRVECARAQPEEVSPTLKFFRRVQGG
jgi:P27 family predicted phage terminase small subunit